MHRVMFPLWHRDNVPLAQLLLAVIPFHSARFCFIFVLVFHTYPLLSSGCRDFMFTYGLKRWLFNVPYM